MANESSFIVGIGASAGGLEALEEFFKVMPADSGLAFVVVVHLDPNHISLLPDILQRQTAMTVMQITDGLLVMPNLIYIIPPNKILSISNRRLKLTDLELPRASHLPIDIFLESLAHDVKNKAVAIILSGTGSDGSLGVREIKAESGLVIVQDETTAKCSGMPKSAFNTGLVDYILPPAQIPAKLIRYSQLLHIDILSNTQQALADDVLHKILITIRNQVGHDFSQYKTNTLYRRIERRMLLHQIEKMPDYWLFLQKNTLEVTALAKELLIGVTSFFRDPEAFELLKTKLLPELLSQKSDKATLRIWVPGCSTGEEAYSVAIILQECFDNLNEYFNVQIFGTDIDDVAIEVARRGFYPKSISAHVSETRLNRFFFNEEEGYRVKKSIREMLVFALQNVTRDPPFTKLDLISCRNLLIYFSPELQAKILPLFHYGLNSSGLLFLGSSETTGQSNEFFTAIDKKWKLFKRAPSADALTHILNRGDAFELPQNSPSLPVVIQKAEELSLLQLVEAILQRSAVLPCAIIDSQQNILYVHGRVGKYLEPAEGKITSNIIEMAHLGIKIELASAIRKAKQEKNTVHTKPCTVQMDNEAVTVAVSVHPLLEHPSLPGLQMVVFEKIEPSPQHAPKRLPNPPQMPQTLEALQSELVSTKANLQISIEELEAANEELKSTNEELQSTNEELQSTNEELETSKEELQSLNEEAVTVNAELQNRIENYQTVNDDLKNLFDSTQIATIFLDTHLCIRRFTPKVKQIIPLVSTDIGRPLENFSCSLQGIHLSEVCHQVLKTLVKHENKLLDDQGRCHLLRVLPYRTTQNVIDGVVLSFEDISERNSIEVALLRSEKRYKSLFEHSPMAIWEEDCSALETALQQLRDQGIDDLSDYLTSHPDEILRLLATKQVLAINRAALHLFHAFNPDEFMATLPRLVVRQSAVPFIPQLLAVWRHDSHVNLAFSCLDLQDKPLSLSMTWIVPSELGALNYANVMVAILAQNSKEIINGTTE